MIILRRILLIGVVWLTAAATLLAGMPHAECWCISGRESSEAPRAAPQRACCCGSGSCAPDGGCPFCGTQTQTTSEQSEDADQSQPVVKPSPCHRVLVHSEVISTAGDNSQKITTAVPPAALATGAEAIVATSPRNLRDTRAICLLPPPTDLLTVLQHFLI